MHPINTYPFYQPYYVQPMIPVQQSPHFVQTRQQFPEVDLTYFQQSIGAFQTLMQDASMILQHLSDSEAFAYNVMNAAQLSDQTEVDQLIKTLGIQSYVKTEFTPLGIKITLQQQSDGLNCCHLSMYLRWH